MSDTGVAVFDLDGTITRHDTLFGLLVRALARRPLRWWRALAMPFAFARFALDRDHGRLKGAMIRIALGGRKRAQLAAELAAHVERVCGTQLRAGALAAIERHRAAGDRLVLLSASPDLYVPEIGRRLGFAEAICTAVRWDGEVLDGRLAGPNRRGAAKVECVAQLRARHPGVPFAAYGNAGTDLAHLRLVEHPLLVNAKPAARAEARRDGIPVDDWP